jgi:hypothetical protein
MRVIPGWSSTHSSTVALWYSTDSAPSSACTPQLCQPSAPSVPAIDNPEGCNRVLLCLVFIADSEGSKGDDL